MSVDKDVVGVMAAYLPVVWVCATECREVRVCSAQYCVCELHGTACVYCTVMRVCTVHYCVCVL